ncbi:unnamed protein product [Rhizoctonia solani]|uniref:Protein kinase domain-containing protein n=1 Tax=Rhizoctonia solani TaxID=456999 RepID=A0A8H3C985_9AGAM|nr:unnamed protein product [Rhizoctonia solani]
MFGLRSPHEATYDNFGSGIRDSHTNTWTTSPKIYSSTLSMTSLDTESYFTSEPKKEAPNISDPRLLFMSRKLRADSTILPTGAHTLSTGKPHPKRHHTLGALLDNFKPGQSKASTTHFPTASSQVFHSSTEPTAITNGSLANGRHVAPAPSTRSKSGEIVRFWQKITRPRRWSEGDSHKRPTLVTGIVLRIASIVKEREDKGAKSEKKEEKRHIPMSGNVAASSVVSALVTRGCNDLSEELNHKSFSESPIACGGLSDIYRGRLFGGTLVAVKAWRITAQQTIGQNAEQLLHAAHELHTWSKCKHPNVLRLLGLATFRDRIGMVSPWMGNGTLPQYIKANPNANRRDLCVQICEGLSYLHNTGVVHGDLKGINVLISDDGTPVLADFGSSTMKDQTLKIAHPGEIRALTVRWSAPELLKARDSGGQTKHSDIYALGMTIYEIITGDIPYHLERVEVRVMVLVVRGMPPIRPVCIPANHKSRDMLWDLLALCWKYSPEGRPSASRVTEMMKEIKLEGVVYRIPQEPDPMHKLFINSEAEATALFPFH